MKAPLSNKPKITQKDLDNKYIMRYFVRFITSKDVVEVDEIQYKIFQKNSFYETIEMKWYISGTVEDKVSIDGSILKGVRSKNQTLLNLYASKMSGIRNVIRSPLEYFNGVESKIDDAVVPYIPPFTEPSPRYSPPPEPEPAPPLVSGMVLYYDAGNLTSYPGSGSVINDLSGFGYNTSIVQIPTQITFDSANSGSFKFDPGSETGGNQACIALPMNSNMPWNYSDITAMTLSFWTKFNPILDNATLFGYSAGIGGARFQLAYNGTNMVVNRAVVAEVGKFSSYTVTQNVITNIVLTKAASQYSLYANGTLVSQFTSSATYTVGTSCLGQNFNPGAPTNFKAIEKMNGNIYNFIAYNTALSAADVLQNYKAQKARFGL